MNIGIAACCTGVVLTKPMVSTASRIHSDRAGVNAPNERSTLVWGAIFRRLALDVSSSTGCDFDGPHGVGRTFAPSKKAGGRAPPLPVPIHWKARPTARVRTASSASIRPELDFSTKAPYGHPGGLYPTRRIITHQIFTGNLISSPSGFAGTLLIAAFTR